MAIPLGADAKCGGGGGRGEGKGIQVRLEKSGRAPRRRRHELHLEGRTGVFLADETRNGNGGRGGSECRDTAMRKPAVLWERTMDFSVAVA